MNFLISIILAFLFISAHAGQPTAKPPIHGGSFDYVIVGAGPGASLAASELSKTSTVLMLETGPFSSTIPKVWRAETWITLQQDPTIEYGYVTAPQSGLAPANQLQAIARAKMTGGCGAHNGMIYEVGSKYDYNEWGVSNPTWTWNNISPLWDEIDNQIAEEVIQPSTFYPEMAAVLAQDGYRYLANPNKGNNMGYRLIRFMAKKLNNTYVKRMTAYEIFIDSVIAGRSNLNILVNTRAEKIIFKNKRATGVLAKNLGTGKKYIFTAKKEVILAGGVIESPKLLLLSGIGAASTLNALNIPVVANVPGVGKNLRDHVFFPVFGPPLKNQSTPIPQPIYANSGYIVMGPDDGTVAGSKPRMYSSLKVMANFFDGTTLVFAAFVEALRLKSTGYVTLASSNPDDHPIINPNYLQNTDDIKEIIFGIRQARKWLNNSLLLNFTEPIENEFYPGWAYQTDAQLTEVIKGAVVSDFHPCGTCKMGPASDPMAVVDQFGRVRGVSKLRVLDASIFPTLVSGNPNQPTMITGLKGARAILNGN